MALCRCPSRILWYTHKTHTRNACARLLTQVELVDMKSDRIPEPIEIEKPVYEMDTGEESHQRDTTSPLLRGSSVVRPVYLSSMHVAQNAYKRVCIYCSTPSYCCTCICTCANVRVVVERLCACRGCRTSVCVPPLGRVRIDTLSHTCFNAASIDACACIVRRTVT